MIAWSDGVGTPTEVLEITACLTSKMVVAPVLQRAVVTLVRVPIFLCFARVAFRWPTSVSREYIQAKAPGLREFPIIPAVSDF